jgi:hypothetical protein
MSLYMFRALNAYLQEDTLYLFLHQIYDIDIFVNCNWVNTRWQWFVYIYTQKLVE